jgi:hypothetical protein
MSFRRSLDQGNRGPIIQDVMAQSLQGSLLKIDDLCAGDQFRAISRAKTDRVARRGRVSTRSMDRGEGGV